MKAIITWVEYRHAGDIRRQQIGGKLNAAGLTGFLQMAFSAIAAQLVAVIFNGTVYPLLLMMLAASIASLLFFLAGTREVGAKVVNSQS